MCNVHSSYLLLKNTAETKAKLIFIKNCFNKAAICKAQITNRPADFPVINYFSQ